MFDHSLVSQAVDLPGQISICKYRAVKRTRHPPEFVVNAPLDRVNGSDNNVTPETRCETSVLGMPDLCTMCIFSMHAVLHTQRFVFFH